MKQLYYVLLLVFMTSMQAAPHQPLSVVEAIDIIWKMNYKDVRELRETVPIGFPMLMGYQMGYEKAIEVQRAEFAGLGILNREIS
jgi:hypothetical protein